MSTDRTTRPRAAGAQGRTGAGVPTGGEFARHAHADAEITLDDEPELAGDAVEDSTSPAHVEGMSATELPVTAVELAYAEGTSDKFYRVFTINESVVTCQYGRNGTYGSFTPRKASETPAAAAKVADKTVAGKAAKGYQIVRSGTGKFDHIPTDSELDSMLNTMPAGTSQEVATPQLREQSAVTAAANTADVDATVLPRVAAALSSRFGRSGSPVTASGAVIPMLAQVATKSEVLYMLASPSWVMQGKLDGDRVMVVVEDGVVSVFNRSGQPKVKNVGDAHLAPFRALTQGRWAFDGEVVGRTLHLFDMPAAGGHLDDRAGFDARYQALQTTLSALDADPASVALVVIATGEDAKRDMLQTAKDGHKEGVIFRDAHASYRSGRTDVLRKHKFVKEIDVYVVEVGKGGRENAVLAVRNEAGEQVIVGQVSTIGKGRIEVGQVLEVAFLYTTSAVKPVLFQPTILRVRTDEKSAAECSIEQLRDAVTDKTVGNQPAADE